MSIQYVDLKRIPDETERLRCAERLLRMRASLADLRARRRDGSILLATWNIRDLGATKFNPAPRTDEAFLYLAEILSSFDLVALQEVNFHLGDFTRLVGHLGPGWDYIVTDAKTTDGGNDERMAFVFNRDKLWFDHVAGEIVLPQGQLIMPAAAVKPPDAQTEEEAALVAAMTETDPDVPAGTAATGQQFARTPFVVSFQAGWFRFNLCTVHIYYGSETGQKLQRRIDEIKALVKFFAQRQDRENRNVTPQRAQNYILLGDFNVVSPEHKTMKALRSRGFTVPEQIDGAAFPDRSHFYDQIAVRVRDPRFKVLDGGMVDMYQDVFTDDDVGLYIDRIKPDRRKSDLQRFRNWRTWQMSDHQPLWVEIHTDFSDDYLRDFAAP